MKQGLARETSHRQLLFGVFQIANDAAVTFELTTQRELPLFTQESGIRGFLRHPLTATDPCRGVPRALHANTLHMSTLWAISMCIQMCACMHVCVCVRVVPAGAEVQCVGKAERLRPAANRGYVTVMQ